MDGETGGDTAHPTDSINGDGPQILSGSLTVVHGGSRGVRVEVPVAGLSLGRKRHASTSDGASLVLDDKVVSRRHAVIEHGAAGWVLRDTESQNAGAVDGVPYEKGATVRLKDGSVLRLGDTLLVFREAMPLPSRADLGAA
ncbi:MAG TPA: FHA domain-containing protein, partial [Kofleriaceae bacterium]|nr:FHA domain-containing protein [Kofleriaceae bacterium]